MSGLMASMFVQRLWQMCKNSLRRIYAAHIYAGSCGVGHLSVVCFHNEDGMHPDSSFSAAGNGCRHAAGELRPAPLQRDLHAAAILFLLCAACTCAAGMLLESLVQPPLNLTFAALASEALAYKPECTSAPSQEPDQAGSDADGPHINAQDLVAAAKHSGSADVVAQFQTWEAQQVNSTFTPSGPPPSHSDALTLWQWVIKVILPFCRLARRARTKMAAAFSAPAQGSTSSCSSTERAAVCAEGAAETGEYRAWVIEQVSSEGWLYWLGWAVMAVCG
eukprot:1160170-Pelagomonas_calceolata.AAC.7